MRLCAENCVWLQIIFVTHACVYTVGHELSEPFTTSKWEKKNIAAENTVQFLTDIFKSTYNSQSDKENFRTARNFYSLF